MALSDNEIDALIIDFSLIYVKAIQSELHLHEIFGVSSDLQGSQSFPVISLHNVLILSGIGFLNNISVRRIAVTVLKANSHVGIHVQDEVRLSYVILTYPSWPDIPD